MNYKKLLPCTLFCFIAWLPSVTMSAQSNYDVQRSIFIEAEQAIKANQLKKSLRLKHQLTEYPLYPYLEFQSLRKHLYKLPTEKVRLFLQTYAQTPLAKKLRVLWLNQLARKKQWALYKEDYVAQKSIRLQCHYLWAQYMTGDKNLAFQGVPALWINKNSQPKACDAIFENWIAAGELTQDQLWQRIYLATDARERQLVKYLTRYLPQEQQYLADLWIRVDANPYLVRTDKYFSKQHPFQLDILAHGAKRMARLKLEHAISYWPAIQKKYTFTDKQIADVAQTIGMRLATAHKPQAIDWLAKIPTAYENDSIREWRIRTVLLQDDWEQVLYWINKLPTDNKDQAIWQYWKARAHSQLQQDKEAQDIYHSLGQQRNFYGLLASEHANLPYPLHHGTYNVSPETLTKIAQLPGILRAKELYQLHRFGAARTEWNYAIKDLSPKIEKPQQN